MTNADSCVRESGGLVAGFDHRLELRQEFGQARLRMGCQEIAGLDRERVMDLLGGEGLKALKNDPIRIPRLTHLGGRRLRDARFHVRLEE